MKCFVFAVALALLFSACMAQTCDITGKWKASYTYDTALGSEEVTIESSFDSDGTYSSESSVDADGNNESCGYTGSIDGDYTYSSDELVLTATSCDFSHCSGECDALCDAACVASPVPETYEVVWASDCGSFHYASQPDYTFEPSSSYWWVWLIVGVVVVVAIVVVIAAVVAGLVLWKKKQATSDAYVYEEA